MQRICHVTDACWRQGHQGGGEQRLCQGGADVEKDSRQADDLVPLPAAQQAAREEEQRLARLPVLHARAVGRQGEQRVECVEWLLIGPGRPQQVL